MIFTVNGHSMVSIVQHHGHHWFIVASRLLVTSLRICLSKPKYKLLVWGAFVILLSIRGGAKKPWKFIQWKELCIKDITNSPTNRLPPQSTVCHKLHRESRLYCTVSSLSTHTITSNFFEEEVELFGMRMLLNSKNLTIQQSLQTQSKSYKNNQQGQLLCNNQQISKRYQVIHLIGRRIAKSCLVNSCMQNCLFICLDRVCSE